LDYDQYQKFKQVCAGLGATVSAKVDELIRNSIAETTGEKVETTNPVGYEALKKQHLKMVSELDKLEKRLEKTGEFDNMADFVEKAGLDLKTYSNLTTMAPQMLEKWRGKGGAKEDMLIFLAYLELIKEKRQVEAKLEETIKAMAPKNMTPETEKPEIPEPEEEETEEPEEEEIEEDEEDEEEESEEEEEEETEAWQQRATKTVTLPWPSTYGSEEDEPEQEPEWNEFEEENYEDFDEDLYESEVEEP